jgi:hypothetical protein
VQAPSEALPAEIGWLPSTHSKQQQQQQHPSAKQQPQQQQQLPAKQSSKQQQQQQQQQQPGSGGSIKQHQVICNSELALKEVIGSGAEGKVSLLGVTRCGYMSHNMLLI